MLFLFLVTTASVLGVISGQDDNGVIQIQPTDDVDKAVGESFGLNCQFEDQYMTNVTWHGPDGNGDTMEIVKGVDPRKSLTKTTNNLALYIKNVTQKDKGMYRCSGYKIENGERIETTKSVSVYVKLHFVDAPTTQNFIVGTTATVVCEVKSDPFSAVTWWIGDTQIKKGGKYSFNSTNLVISNVTEEDERTYRCLATQSIKINILERMIKVLINTPPKVNKFKKKRTVIAGDRITIICNGTGDPEPSFSWWKRGTKRTEDTKVFDGSVYDFEVDANEGDNRFTCVASNIAGKDTRDLTLMVNVRPNITLAEGDSAVEGESAQLRCVADGIPEPKVYWYDATGQLEETATENSTFANNSQLPAGTWSKSRVAEYSDGEAILSFSNVSPEDKGAYECRAVNDAGVAIENVHLDVQYAPRPKDIYNKWACEGSSTMATLTCDIEANPEPEYTWGRYIPIKDDSANSTGFEMLNNSSMPAGYQLEVGIDGGLLLLIQVDEAENPFGTYICVANNSFGTANETAELRMAKSPSPPLYVEVRNITTREATISFTIGQPVDYVPYTKFIVTLASATPGAKPLKEEVTVENDRETYEYQFTNLEHGTEYTYFVETVNCKSSSDPSNRTTFMTKKIVKPESVEIVSGKLSHDEYVVEWRLKELGGGMAKNVTIEWYKITKGIDAENKTLIDSVNVDPDDVEKESGSYPIKDLEPLSEYEIRVTIHNEVGSTPAVERFSTPSKPTTTTAEVTAVPEFSVGGFDPMFIGIIVGVLILIILIIDLICCCMKSGGLTYYLVSRCRGNNGKRGVDEEEGSAEFRRASAEQDNEGAARCDVEEEKQPLADKVEPVANGDPALSKEEPAGEQTPLSEKGAAACPSGNGTPEGAKEQTTENNAETAETVKEDPK